MLDTSSAGAARSLAKALRVEDLDVEVAPRQARIWCFADDEAAALEARDVVIGVVDRMSNPVLQVPPMVRMWSERHHRYVDPEAPDEDPDTGALWIESEVAPGEVSWRVRLTLGSAFDFRLVRRQLPLLRRPLIEEGRRHIDLGATDEADAEATAAHARELAGVVVVETTAIRGRLRRWLIRQRLAGNYAPRVDERSAGYDYADGGGGAGGDGGGADGGAP